jgi:RNA polymerase sigma factor (sigma-70 family)
MAAEAWADQSDRELVERFTARHDEAVFEALVRRHGPMVYRVCWRVLQHSQDTEDAFQATFLILAQKLRTLRKRDSLASWLHGVAHRVSLKAKAQAATRRQHEARLGVSVPVAPDEMPWKELRTVLDEEMGQLPEKWRLPLVLAYLEGRSQDEAAVHLGWSKSTFIRRLDEARQALGRRLSRRGVVWQAALSAVLLSQCVVSAAVPSALIRSTVESATAVAAGETVIAAISPKVAALTEGVMKAMFVTKLKSVLTVVLVLAALAGGAGLLCQTQAADQSQDSNKVVQAPKPADNQPPPQAKPAESTSPKDAKPGQKVLTPEEAIRLKPKEPVTVKFEVAAVLTMRASKSNMIGANAGFNEVLLLKASDSFVVQVRPPAMETLKRLGIDPEKHFKGKTVRVTGQFGPGPFVNLLPPGLYPDQYQLAGIELSQIEVLAK